MAKVPQELLQQIRDKVNLVEIVGEHVVLRKSGSNYSGLCPFHSERSPSFSVNENKQVYHCFGCKKGGDLFSFVMEVHGLSFPEAIEEVADRARIALPKDWGDQGGNENPELLHKRNVAREKLVLAYKVNRFAASFYHSTLDKMSEAQEYFRNRGVAGDLARNFYVGAVPASWDALSTFLVQKKAPIELAVELGLIRPSQKGTKAAESGPGYFDLFRNRAMFPILNMRGKVAGFGGRTMPGPEFGGDSPKYLNSPESLIFQKSKLAYGLYQAQKHVREKDEIILVEGYFDVLALHAAGFENAVATCGTALSVDHLSIFKRLATRITLLFDGDHAGITATERAMEIGLENGLVLYGATMPEDLDPDEVLFDQTTGKATPEGKERMAAILGAARPILDARIDEAVQSAIVGPEARTQALKRIAAWLVKFNDPVGREIRIQAVQKQMGVSRQLLDSAMGVKPSQRPQGRPVEISPVAKKVARTATASRAPISTVERILLATLVRGVEFSPFFTDAKSKLPPGQGIYDLFEHPGARSFVEDLFKDPANLKQFREAPDMALSGEIDPQVRSVLTEALVAAELPYTESDIKNAFVRCLGRIWARFSQRVKSLLADAEAKEDAELRDQLMKEYLDVQRKMKEFNNFYDEA